MRRKRLPNTAHVSKNSRPTSEPTRMKFANNWTHLNWSSRPSNSSREKPISTFGCWRSHGCRTPPIRVNHWLPVPDPCHQRFSGRGDHESQANRRSPSRAVHVYQLAPHQSLKARMQARLIASLTAGGIVGPNNNAFIRSVGRLARKPSRHLQRGDIFGFRRPGNQCGLPQPVCQFYRGWFPSVETTDGCSSQLR